MIALSGDMLLDKRLVRFIDESLFRLIYCQYNGQLYLIYIIGGEQR